MVTRIDPSTSIAPPSTAHRLAAPSKRTSATTIATSESRPVPMKVPRNSRFNTVTLIACMAWMPSAGARRARAGITKLEKAKNTPPIAPLPSAHRTSSTVVSVSTITGPPCARSWIAAREGFGVGAVADCDHGIVRRLDAVRHLPGQEQQRLLRFGAVGHRLVDGEGAELDHLAIGGPGLGGVDQVVVRRGELRLQMERDRTLLEAR